MYDESSLSYAEAFWHFCYFFVGQTILAGGKRAENGRAGSLISIIRGDTTNASPDVIIPGSVYIAVLPPPVGMITTVSSPENIDSIASF